MAIALALPLAALAVLAGDAFPYLGHWSNGRGETLTITKETLQIASDKPVPYRDVTRAGARSSFELQITVPGEMNAFSGKTLAVACENGAMKITGYLSHRDYMRAENPQQVVTWEKDTDGREAKSSPIPQSVHTPPPGSAERKAIARTLHAPCERDLQQPVILKFDQLRVVRDWAMARVQPFQPNQKSIDYRKTKYKEQIAEGMFDEAGEALLKRENGRWTVLEWSFGNTDTEMFEWIKEHGAPKALAE